MASGFLELSSASAVGFVLSPKEYSCIYNLLARRRSSKSLHQKLKAADTTTERAQISAKELAYILFPRPNIVEEVNNDNSSPLYKTKRSVRRHSRLFFQIYAVIVSIKSLQQIRTRKKNALIRSVLVLKDKPAADMALSITSISFSYKIIYDFLVFLKPYILDLLTTFIHEQSLLYEMLDEYSHTIIPLISGICAGSFLRLYPQKAARDLIAVYAMVRTLEYVYNYLDDNGYLIAIKKPKILGSWALFPFAYSQLFYSFIFERDTNSNFINSTLFSLSNDFFPTKPTGYPRHSVQKWPTPSQIVDSIGTISKLHYPKFTSTLMFPDVAVIPEQLDAVKPVIIRAHPAISTLTGALLHPWEPSQFRALAIIVLKQYTKIGKYVFLLYLIKLILVKKFVSTVEPDAEKSIEHLSPEIPASKRDNSSPADAVINRLKVVLKSVFYAWKTSTFIIMTVVSTWAGIEFTQEMWSKRFLPIYRFRLIAFLAGFWSILDRDSGRGRFMFAVRAAILSNWRSLIKNHKIKPIRNGDVMIFSISFGILMALFDRYPGSISGPAVRKVLSWIDNDGQFIDPMIDPTEKYKEKDD